MFFGILPLVNRKLMKSLKLLSYSLLVLVLLMMIFALTKVNDYLTFKQDLKCREYAEREYPGYEGMETEYLYSRKKSSCIGIIKTENFISIIDLYKTKKIISYWDYQDCIRLSQTGPPYTCSTKAQFEKERIKLIGR